MGGRSNGRGMVLALRVAIVLAGCRARAGEGIAGWAQLLHETWGGNESCVGDILLAIKLHNRVC